MKGKIIYFDEPGEANTEEALSVAKQRAKELGIKTVIVATTRGNTAARAVEVFEGMKVVVVSHVTGMREPNLQELTDENRLKIESKGGIVLTICSELNIPIAYMGVGEKLPDMVSFDAEAFVTAILP